MARQQHHFSFSNRRKASAIIGALVMAGIMAMAVGVMLSSSNTAIRRSGEKIAYEEAYQMALAGTHVARAWIIDPELASSMAGSADAKTELDSLIQKATAMNQDIAADIEARLKANPNDSLAGLNLYGTQRFSDAGISFEKSLADGRNVVYTLPVKPMLNLPPSADGDQFNDNLFSDDIDDGNKNYVEWVRITTPGTTAQTSASLRECTFIVEAKGVSEVAGKKKERVVQQRVLVKPNEPANPLIGATEAIITAGTFSAKAMSSGNVHWGPVLAKEDIVNPFFNAINQTKDGKGKNAAFKGWEFTLNQAKKANLAGLPVADSGNNSSFKNLDKWIEWRAGGKLYAGQHGTDYMFEGIPGVPDAGEFDFFKELMEGTLNVGETPLNIDNFELGEQFGAAGTSLHNPDQFNGLVELLEDNTYSSGALVQTSEATKNRVDEFFGEMNYDTLKEYAISHDAYYTWDGSTLRNNVGVPVSIPSMKPGNPDTLSPQASPDRMLFIDSIAGTDSQPFTEAIELPSFWKGVVYANGPIYTSGAGSAPDILMRDPDEFNTYRNTGTSTAGTAKGVFVDGIVICNGTADLGANGAIYGTLAAKQGVITGANFSVFYNPANAEGRLRDTSKGAQPFGLIAGKLYETKVPAI